MNAVELREVADLNPALDESPSGDDSVAFVPMAAVSADLALTVGAETRSFADVAKGYTPFVHGDLLVAKITPCFENGKIAQALLPTRVGLGSTEFHVIRPRPGKVDPRYLLHFLRQNWVRREGTRRMTGSAGQRRVPAGFLAQLDVPLPDLGEQRRVASLLDKVEELRLKRRTANVLLDDLAEAIFLDLFGDPSVRSSSRSVQRLENHLLFVTSGGRGWAKYYSTTGTRFIRSLDVRMNHIGDEAVVFVTPPENAEARRTRTMNGDVLLTITGSQIGRVAAVPPELAGAYVSQHVAILRPDPSTLLPDYLSFFLSMRAGGQRQIAQSQYGQTKPGLNFEQIRRFQVPVPPIKEQREFVGRIRALKAFEKKCRAAATALDELFGSLQHRAFNGAV